MNISWNHTLNVVNSIDIISRLCEGLDIDGTLRSKMLLILDSFGYVKEGQLHEAKEDTGLKHILPPNQNKPIQSTCQVSTLI